MKAFRIDYPVRPHTVNREWGVVDPLYKEFGFLRHNGIDIALSVGTEVHAPLPSNVTRIGNEPNGSGLFVSLLSRRTYEFPDGAQCRVELTFMHLSQLSVQVGQSLTRGAVIGLGGVTGRTTGPHTHMAPKRVRMRLLGGYRDYDRNDAANTFDPTPYWSGEYATLPPS